MSHAPVEESPQEQSVYRFYTMRGICGRCHKQPIARGSISMCVQCLDAKRAIYRRLRPNVIPNMGRPRIAA